LVAGLIALKHALLRLPARFRAGSKRRLRVVGKPDIDLRQQTPAPAAQTAVVGAQKTRAAQARPLLTESNMPFDDCQPT